MKTWMAAAGLAAALAAGGCATGNTVEGRIERNRGFFDSLPVATQARIRGGQTELGFTREETLLALGEPARKVQRRDAGGLTEVWVYTATESRFERGHVDFVGVPDGRGGRFTGGGNVTVLMDHETETGRVEFRGGVVTAIERTVGE